jgi:hypothetical protein
MSRIPTLLIFIPFYCGNKEYVVIKFKLPSTSGMWRNAAMSMLTFHKRRELVIPLQERFLYKETQMARIPAYFRQEARKESTVLFAF